MIRRPPRSTRTDTLCPYTTLFRSDHLRVHFIGALGTDQIGDFLHRIDVRRLQVALPQRTEADGVRVADRRLARGGRLEEQIVALCVEAGLVDEGRQLDLAELLRLRLAGALRFDDAGAATGRAHV